MVFPPSAIKALANYVHSEGGYNSPQLIQTMALRSFLRIPKQRNTDHQWCFNSQPRFGSFFVLPNKMCCVMHTRAEKYFICTLVHYTSFELLPFSSSVWLFKANRKKTTYANDEYHWASFGCTLKRYSPTMQHKECWSSPVYLPFAEIHLDLNWRMFTSL